KACVPTAVYQQTIIVGGHARPSARLAHPTDLAWSAERCNGLYLRLHTPSLPLRSSRSPAVRPPGPDWGHARPEVRNHPHRTIGHPPRPRVLARRRPGGPVRSSHRGGGEVFVPWRLLRRKRGRGDLSRAGR